MTEPWLTEAEYAATLPERTDRVVAEMNERLAAFLPDGLRFEFAPIDDLGHPRRPDGSLIPETPAAIRRREARISGRRAGMTALRLASAADEPD